MKRRSRAGGEPIKGRRRKTPEPKHRNAPKAAAHSNSSPAAEETEVARLSRELDDALERHPSSEGRAEIQIVRHVLISPGERGERRGSVSFGLAHLVATWWRFWSQQAGAYCKT